MFREYVILEEGVFFEVFFASPSHFCLRCGKDGKVLVEYSNTSTYELRSVEKLRYDFEKDVENALRKGR
jgi:hypothetical protein